MPNATATTDEAFAQVIKVAAAKLKLYGDGSRLGNLRKSYNAEIKKQQTEQKSNQGVSTTGEQIQPFDFSATSEFLLANIHHSTCIQTKKEACVGLGHVKGEGEEKSKVAVALDPLCESSWQNLLHQVAEDYFTVGNGYIEVVRESAGGEILGLYHIMAKEVTIYVERNADNNVWNKHYVIDSGYDFRRRFAQFGDLEGFESRAISVADQSEKVTTSEVIHIKKASSLDRWYGFPEWLAAVPVIELVQMLQQHFFDFFQNRGVPEFMLFLHGNKINKADWELISNAMKAQIGLGNSYKSVALNIPDEINIDLHKLGLEQSQDGKQFQQISEQSALAIVSAHRVPPLLAGIQIPGKLGATNELPNALMAFQVLVMGPAQIVLQSTFGCTLGNPETNGGLGLTEKDFEFNKVTEEIDVGTMETVGGMRETVPEAKANGRDLDEGLKD